MTEKKEVPSRLIHLAVPAAILALGVFGFWTMGTKPPVPTRNNNSVSAPLVNTIQVSRQMKGIDIKVESYVVSHREIILAAEVAGKIAERADSIPRAQANAGVAQTGFPQFLQMAIFQQFPLDVLASVLKVLLRGDRGGRFLRRRAQLGVEQNRQRPDHHR